MAELKTEIGADGSHPRIVRRTVFAAIAVGYAASYIPQSWASGPPPGYAAFVAVSQYLTGHPMLDAALAARAFNALVADDQDFANQVDRLDSLISSQKPDPLTLQSSLDSAKSPLASIPRKIVKAWYLGVVGDGDRARCIAFENNLTNRAVADHLRPPSYCFGAYGSWTQKPL
jgi:hypothetical protein